MKKLENKLDDECLFHEIVKDEILTRIYELTTPILHQMCINCQGYNPVCRDYINAQEYHSHFMWLGKRHCSTKTTNQDARKTPTGQY